MSDYNPKKPSPYYFEKDRNKARPGLYYQPPPQKKGKGEDAQVVYPNPLWISDPFDVVARTRDGDSNNHGLLLEWKDPDKQQHQWLMPFELLAGDGVEIRKILLNGGLRISTKKTAKEHLLTYLNEASPTKVARAVFAIGWQDSGVYVLPHVTIGA